MDNEKAVGLLHDLYTINYERAKGYENASFLNHLFDLDTRGTFALLSNQSRQHIYALKQHLENLTKKPSLSPSPHGQLYKAWTDHNISFNSIDKTALVESFVSAESAIQEIYERALQGDISLNEEMRRLLRDQQAGFRRSQATVSQIRNSLAKVAGRTSSGRL